MPGSDRPAIQEQQQYWDQRWTKTPRPNAWQTRRGNTILEMIRKLPLQQSRILDMGCGTGWFTEALTDVGQATGIDLSEAAIEIAKSNFPGVDYIAGDVYKLPFPKAHFDVVVSQEVIAHVQDQPAYVEMAAQYVKPGGYLIITTVNKFVHLRQCWEPSPEGHIELWLDKNDLHRLLQPWFEVLDTFTIIPMGERGILRLVNSYKLNRIAELFVSRERIESWKEKAGLGWCIISLARRRT